MRVRDWHDSRSKRLAFKEARRVCFIDARMPGCLSGYYEVRKARGRASLAEYRRAEPRRAALRCVLLRLAEMEPCFYRSLPLHARILPEILFGWHGEFLKGRVICQTESYFWPKRPVPLFSRSKGAHPRPPPPPAGSATVMERDSD